MLKTGRVINKSLLLISALLIATSSTFTRIEFLGFTVSAWMTGVMFSILCLSFLLSLGNQNLKIGMILNRPSTTVLLMFVAYIGISLGLTRTITGLQVFWLRVACFWE